MANITKINVNNDENEYVLGTFSDAILMSGENNKTLTEELNTIKKDNTNSIPIFDIKGEGDTYSASSYYFGIKAGNRYRVWIKNPDVDMTGISGSTKSRLSIIADYINGTTENIKVWNVNTELPEYYDFIAPNNIVSIHVGGRCNTGSVLSLYIEDITQSYNSLNDLVSDKDNVIYNFATPYNIIKGKCIRSTGAEYANANRYATDYINITNFNRLVYTRTTTSGKGLSIGSGLCFYDVNKEPIEDGFIDEVKNAQYSGYVIQEATIPEGAVYARFTGWITLIERGQFCFGDPTTNPVIAKLLENDSNSSIPLIDGVATFFSGAGSSMSYGDKVLVHSSQKVIKCILRDKDYPKDEIGSTNTLFGIYAYDSSDTSTTIMNVLVTEAANLKEYYICAIPDGTKYLKIGGRCNSGYDVYCDIIDISTEYPVKHIFTETEFCIYSSNTRGLLNYDLRSDVIINVVCKNSSTGIQHTENSYTFNEEHTPVVNELNGYSTRNISLEVGNVVGEYIGIFFKGSSLTGQKILGDYSIVIYAKKDVNNISSYEKGMSIYGSIKTSNSVSTIGEYTVKLREKEKVRISIPTWLKVAFYGGLRDGRNTTQYYYDNDIVEFGSEKGFIAPKITRIDDRTLTSSYVEELLNQCKINFFVQDVHDGNIIERNFDTEKYIGAIRATPNTVENLTTIIHTSDTHGDAERLKNVHDWADYICADLLINTGDNPFYTMADGVQYVSDIVKAHKTDFANCLGNHDTYDNSGVADYTQKNIGVFAEDYHYYKSIENDEPVITDKCYYYKDLVDKNLRIIALDLYEDVVTSNYKSRVSGTQMQWFISTLLSTPANYGVIVIMHQVPHTLKAINGKTEFNDTTMNKGNVAENEWQCASIDSDYMTGSKLTGNPFGKIIDAFISKNTVSGSYNQKTADMSESEVVNYTADFTNVNEGVEFIMYLNGHTHRDFVGYVADCENNQLNINVCSTSPIAQSTGIKSPADIMRDTNGSNQDAFNIYTINRTDKTVGIARVGANLSKTLVDRKVMFVSYI